ncbi:MAG: hypothetical protein GEU79_10930 [Acidimicrobiia bacterium]|nr:hypothetical protein [Acidimicrobiia bacterium]
MGGEIWSAAGVVPGSRGVNTTDRTFFREVPGEDCASIRTDVPWLSVTPTTGRTAADDVTEIEVTVDGSELEVGEYHATLLIQTSDAATVETRLPVTLTVTESEEPPTTEPPITEPPTTEPPTTGPPTTEPPTTEPPSTQPPSTEPPGPDWSEPDPDFQFGDVGEGHLFDYEIHWLAANGITFGCNPPENTLFCPDDGVTRGQMAAFLARALDLPAGDSQFDDTIGHVFENDVAALAAAGITYGCNPPDNTKFCPDDGVTRGQMAAFLVRALDLPAASGAFDDTVGHVFENDVAALAAAGITYGCNPPDNTLFCPNDGVTRGQMAAFLYRALAPGDFD